MPLLVEYDTILSPVKMCDYDTWLFMVSEIISRPGCFATDIARMWDASDMICFNMTFNKTLLFRTHWKWLKVLFQDQLRFYVLCWRLYDMWGAEGCMIFLIFPLFVSFFLSQRFLVTRLSRGLYHIPALANWRSTDFAHEYWTDFVSPAKSIQMFLPQPPVSLCCFFQPFAILLGTMAMHQLCTPSLQSSAPGYIREV